MASVFLNTAGNGLWSSTEIEIRITDMVLDKGTIWEGETIKDAYGEFRVYFDTHTWNTAEDGLIYTDKRFLRELREFLNAHGLPGEDVCYSEQGMQGDDYVSLDAGGKFYAAWMAKFGIAQEQLIEVY